MKIAFIFRSKNVHILQRAKWLNSRGHEIIYFGFMPDDSDISLDNFSFIKYFNFKQIFSNISFLDFLLNRWKILRKCQELGVDVVHIQSPLYFASFFSNKFPYIVENMGSDVILLSKYNFIRRIIYFFAYRRASSVIQDSFVSKYSGISWGASRAKNYVIDIGVDFNIFNKKINIQSARSALGVDNNSRIIFSPRIMVPNTNIELILDSAEEILRNHKDVYFFFASNPKSKKLIRKFNKLIDTYGDKIRILGYLDNVEELPLYYAASSIVLSVPTSDSSPLSVYEAMACGNNVVVSNLKWIRGKFLNNKHLYTVELCKSDIVHKIEQILKEKDDSISNNAYKRVLYRYNQDVQLCRLERLYQKSMESK
jgi:glycosyltransferase involved in cell wall biosynthesis